jgi:serine/threonine-protein kinase
MADNPRVEQLLEELLDSGGTPEEACRTCPELLPQVRAGWQRLRALKAEIGALFPPSPVSDDATPPPGRPPTCHGFVVTKCRGYWAAAAWASSTRLGTCASIVPSP